MLLSDLDYSLPEELIAQAPVKRRDASRLLVVQSPRHAHHRFADLVQLLPPALFVVNNARVIAARMIGRKPTGGRVELLLIERLEGRGSVEKWAALGRASKPLRPGLSFRVGELELQITERHKDGSVEVVLKAPESVTEAIERAGQLPLPPYIRRPVDVNDAQRYQTMFAQVPGAVAAPTAGLHFTPELVQMMRAAGHAFVELTLYVGPGTFMPVRVDDLDEHSMHTERFYIAPDTADAINQSRAEGRGVVAVGTTVVRTLESAWRDGRVVAGDGRTDLFIRPPYRAKAIDHLVTNFHLPKSTLLALVMALGGEEAVRSAYTEAIDQRYRFFSYGDAMLLRNLRGVS